MKKETKKKMERIVWAALLMTILAAGQVIPVIPSAYAAGGAILTARNTGTSQVKPGDRSVSLEITLRNEGAAYSFTNARLKVKADPYDLETISEETTQATGIEGGSTDAPKELKLGFLVDIRGSARGGSKEFELELTSAAGSKTITVIGDLYVDTAGSLPSAASDKLTPLVEWSYEIRPSGKLSQGSDNSILLKIRNRGNTDVRSASCSITLPEGLSVPKGSTTQYIGRISKNMTGSVSFPISVSEDIKGGTYSITARCSGTDEADENISFENTFYTAVEGKKEGSVKDIAIQNISVPAEVKAQTDFTLSFSVKNEGADTVEDLKARAVMPEGLMNRSSATFVIDALKGGEAKTFSVTMFAKKDADGSYPIQLTVDPVSADGEGGAAQYASVFVTKETSGSAKTPLLMVDQYHYGGASVLAGREFALSLGIVNTSDKDLSNIKIAVLSDDGTFVPVGSSNSFFIDTVKAGGRIEKQLMMSSKPAAEQKTSPVTVKMSYEDANGQAFTAEDTVSIPVMQVTRFVVDQIVPPYECYMGNPGSASVQFYNMGKTTLNNLKINAEGNFDITESNSAYIGNMQSGASDSYTFNFMPRQVGPMEGKVIFTYEDADGVQTSYEEPFLFQVVEMPVWDEPEPEEVEKKKGPPWTLIIIAIALVWVVIGIIIWRRIRKARLNKKLEIQDAAFYAALDLDKELKTAEADKEAKAEAGESAKTEQEAKTAQEDGN